MYVRCKLCNMKVQTIEKISCNFRQKIQNFAKCKYRFNSSGTPLFVCMQKRENAKIPARKIPYIIFMQKCQNLLALKILYIRYLNNIAYVFNFGTRSVLLEKNSVKENHEIIDQYIVSLQKIFLSRITELCFQLLILYKFCKICNNCLNHLRLVENSHVHMYMLKMLVNKFKI